MIEIAKCLFMGVLLIARGGRAPAADHQIRPLIIYTSIFFFGRVPLIVIIEKSSIFFGILDLYYT
jgi:hypothetical protein